MSSTELVQKDWEDRTFLSAVEQSLLDCAMVINKFGTEALPSPSVPQKLLDLASSLRPVSDNPLPCYGADESARFRLGNINEKISQLERSMLMVEARLCTVDSLS